MAARSVAADACMIASSGSFLGSRARLPLSWFWLPRGNKSTDAQADQDVRRDLWITAAARSLTSGSVAKGALHFGEELVIAQRPAAVQVRLDDRDDAVGEQRLLAWFEGLWTPRSRRRYRARSRQLGRCRWSRSCGMLGRRAFLGQAAEVAPPGGEACLVHRPGRDARMARDPRPGAFEPVRVAVRADHHVDWLARHVGDHRAVRP